MADCLDLCMSASSTCRYAASVTSGQARRARRARTTRRPGANTWQMIFRSCCIGLGPAAAPLLQAIQARTDITQVEPMVHHAPDPQALTHWLRNQPAPADYLVLLVDPSDPQAVADLAAQVRDWRPPDVLLLHRAVAQ